MRVKGGFKTRRRHKRVLKLAEGMRGRRSKNFKHAKLGVQKGLQYAYRDRRTKKREFRALWIVRINAAARLNGLSYSKFTLGCKKAGITLDRKVLAELAMHNPEAFSVVAVQAQAALAA